MQALEGIRVIEMAGLAPVPYCGMILADFGADVVRVDRPNVRSADFLSRGKRSIAVDLKNPEGVETLLRLLERADVLVEPFRPGVMERLGLGPEIAQGRNPRLIYARLTGFGQTGPYANMAGHDINYIATAGTLGPIARLGQRPLAPLNLVGDFAGGGMLCAMGIAFALIERSRSDRGQIIDAAMVDGAANLATFLFKLRQIGAWNDEAGTNLLDSGAPFYDTYETSDGKFMAVGALEPQFYAALLKGLGLDGAPDLPAQMDRSGWPVLRERFTAAFRDKTRADWCAIFDGTDACTTPVLGLGEVAQHPHNRDRGTFAVASDGHTEPCPAPRLSRTPGIAGTTRPEPGQHTAEILRQYGFTSAEIERLAAAGAAV
jgi:alpha-methylacyl-CoA racemase